MTGHAGRKHSPEAIAKMRAAKLGKKRPPETIERIREVNLGRKHSPEAIAKMREAKLGKKLTPWHVENIRAARRGKKRAPAAIAKNKAAWDRKLHALGVPVGAEYFYRLARAKKYSKADAVAFAQQNAPIREAAE